jgi:hypothetical protein
VFGLAQSAQRTKQRQQPSSTQAVQALSAGCASERTFTLDAELPTMYSLWHALLIQHQSTTNTQSSDDAAITAAC